MTKPSPIADVIQSSRPLRELAESTAARIAEDPTSMRRLQLEDLGPIEQTAPIVPTPYIAAKFGDSSFATYQPDPAAPSQQSALRTTLAFCRKIHAGEAPMVALIGSTGTGKSHLLYSAAKALHAVGHRVFTRPWYLLADQLRYGGPALFSDRWLEPYELRHAVMQQPVVMIDEVRPTAGTDFDDTELAKLVCHAWDNGRAMLITTNVSPLTTVLGAAVASRFTQVTITGPDHRQS